MEQRDYVYVGEPIPKIETPDNKDFLLNFQRSMLLSLVKRKLLTASQMEQVMDIIVRKPSFK